MIDPRIRPVINYIAAGALLLGAVVPAHGQERAPAPQTPQVVIDSVDAGQARDDFRELLNRHPPSLGRVLKLDPSLMTNEAYLASYPAVAAFLKQHPEIARSPSYFLDFVQVTQGEWRQPSDGVRLWENMLQGLTIFGVFAIILGTVIWLVRTVIEQRRWSRQTKVQTDVHTKLFDRLSSNEDLLAYIQTPAGRRFLEAAPLALSSTPSRPIGAPVSRILWSVQIGIVIVAAALGVLFVSGRVIDEVAQPLFAIAAVGIALGIGFVASSAVAYVLSRNMGLLESAPGGSAGPDSQV
jgi:hypothetical protein